ncbi:unnamed protein product [Lepeophtheirus salmonis]|uniref:(salmon louse) hypothetical protein n=1 Tax=Lepeophtheirus salmonis TaxID=72036 RepID=A0A7R8HA04_LEPSM|nr:unnamed protein product [Lepeophtheirus salmonis]CAF2965004.1 unnamed protein product [Lepeophtheirus salmonis]
MFLTLTKHGLTICVLKQHLIWYPIVLSHRIGLLQYEFMWMSHGFLDLRIVCSHGAQLEGEIPQPPHYMKCLAPLRAANGEARAVTGGANGRISLLSFDSRSGSVREFGKPASSRAVLGLSWNGNSLLAAAFEKNRNEPALKIFDASPFLASHNHPLGQEHVRSPLGIEYGETCSSLCWINTFGGETLVYGSSGKYLRLIDIRQDSSRGARASTSTRAVYGVTVDPFLDCRIASHVDNQNRKITKISWSPTRMGLLCSITDNADSLLLHDIQSWAVIMEDGEPAVTERKLLLEPSVDSQVFTSFVWHPASENTLISTTNKGILKRNIVPERISPSWGARHSLCWPQGGVFYFGLVKDMGHNLKKNMKILSTDAALSTAWKWILTTKQLLENDKDLKVEFPSNSPPGVRTVLKILVPQESSASDTLSEQRSWHGINLLKPRRFYRSTSREKAIKIAGWSSGAGYDNSELISFLESLEKNGEYTRAAAIALFSLDLRLSLTILQRGASNCQSEDKEKATSMRMVSMALSGYTEDKSGLWHEMVPGTNTLVGDPYLQILFTFLMYSQEDYKAILDSDLQLGDKVAFACGYLSDTHLTEYIESNWNQLKEKGNLLGLILCGMRSVESVELLQRYLDITGDIQTVSWMTSKGLFIYVSCNFCGRCIGQHVKTGMPRPLAFVQKQSQLQPFKSNGWLQACSSCRKPLPRCSVCLINMGTMSGLNIHAAPPSRDKPKKISPFKNFFSWCQTCRHGGHALHILDWFKDHAECPVSGCSCKCSVLDETLLKSSGFVHQKKMTSKNWLRILLPILLISFLSKDNCCSAAETTEEATSEDITTQSWIQRMKDHNNDENQTRNKNKLTAKIEGLFDLKDEEEYGLEEDLLDSGSDHVPVYFKVQTLLPTIVSSLNSPISSLTSSSSSSSFDKVHSKGVKTGYFPPKQRVMPRVSHMEAECSDDIMKLRVQFNSSFTGLIYSAGYAYDTNCIYVNGTGDSIYEFYIQLNRCGTLGGSDHKKKRDTTYKKTQSPLKMSLTCEYGYDFWKTVTFPFLDVEVNTADPVHFSLNPPECHMEIRQGYGTSGHRITGPVHVGDPLTLLIYMRSEYDGFDILVNDCYAHNGANKKIQLIDHHGCPVDEKLISRFQGNWGMNNAMYETVIYAHMKTFRFTGTPALYIECDIRMCHGKCPTQSCNWKNLNGNHLRRKRALEEEIDQESIILSEESTNNNSSLSERFNLFQAIHVLQSRDENEKINETESELGDSDQSTRAKDSTCLSSNLFTVVVGILTFVSVTFGVAVSILYIRLKKSINFREEHPAHHMQLPNSRLFDEMSRISSSVGQSKPHRDCPCIGRLVQFLVYKSSDRKIIDGNMTVFSMSAVKHEKYSKGHSIVFLEL